MGWANDSLPAEQHSYTYFGGYRGWDGWESLGEFQLRYENSSKLFNWKFTRADLAELLGRLSEYEEYAQRLAA
jgi:hypothetical protein